MATAATFQKTDQRTTTSDQEDETGAEIENEGVPQDRSAAELDYFEVLTRATNDAVRDWNVRSDTVTWRYGLGSTLGHSGSAEVNKIKFWLDHLHPDDREPVEQSLRQALESSDERWTAEYRFRRGDGVYLSIFERALIIRSPKGAPLRVVGAMMDVTARRQLQERECRSERMEAFGQLAGGVAHDFNNFLTTILGYSDLLLSESAVKGRVATQLKEIREAAGRASALTNQLLAFSRRQSLEPSIIEVNSLIINLERSIFPLLGERVSVVCNLHPDREGRHVRVDAWQFAQILVNLATNARDAMGNGGRLTITTSVIEVRPGESTLLYPNLELPAGEYVEIAFADTGCGMTDEVKARLFEPFFSTKGQNSGLGLATSYGIIRQSGGYIGVESEPGKGATFHIFLPRVAAPAVSYKKPSERKLATGTETILVLEDEVGVRHLSVRVLRRLGYRVLEAAHPADAKRLITGRGAPRIDLLLTDMVLPEVSGRDFADWLHRTSPETKVIFISGYLQESLDPRDRHKPGMRFLAKPFSAEQLASKVRQTLDGGR